MKNAYQFRRDGKKYKHHRGFKIKFMPATNTRGERVGIYDMRFRRNDVIPYDYSLSNIREIAIQWLEKSGIKITGFFYNHATHEYFLTTDSFESVNEISESEIRKMNEIKNAIKNFNMEVH